MKFALARLCLMLFAAIFAVSCSNKVDSTEIVEIFDRHSYKQVNLANLIKQYDKTGFEALPAFDERAAYYPKSWLPAIPYREEEKNNAGIGLILWRTSRKLVVVSVFKGSPAYEAGIRAGDIITHINETEVKRMRNEQIQAAIYGSQGMLCRLRGINANGANIRASLRREFGGMPIAWGFNIPFSKTGYVRILSFTKKSTVFIRQAMNDVLDNGAQRIILDLRGNCSGSLAELSTALSYFAPGGGKLFSSSSRHKGYSMAFLSKLKGSYYGIPYTILTDGVTSSRSEIFAEALKDWGGAEIIGERTAGNTAVTRGFTLKNGGVVRITVSKLFPPSEKDLDDKGLMPDLPVQLKATVLSNSVEYPQALASSDELIKKAIFRR